MPAFLCEPNAHIVAHIKLRKTVPIAAGKDICVKMNGAGKALMTGQAASFQGRIIPKNG